MNAENIVPIIDISGFTDGSDAASRDVAEQVRDACEKIGFIVITGHGVSSDILGRINSIGRQFFDLPVETKNRYDMAGHYSGYQGMEAATLAYSIGDETAKPDLREGFGGGRPDSRDGDPYFMQEALAPFCPPIPWPGDEVPGFKAQWMEYYSTMADLGARIMRIFAAALDLPTDYFDSMLDRHVSSLAVYNYPEQEGEPEEGKIRGGAHTDFGSLTIVYSDFEIAGGLQVQLHDDSWFDVPAIPDAFVINLGDMMQRWTNDTWVSTMHRVGNPPRDEAASNRRQSIIFFHIPNYDATVECIPTCTGPDDPPKYDPILVGEHHLMKMGMMFEDNQ